MLFGVVSLLGCSNEVYATGSSGGGSGGSACTKNCGKPRWWGVYPSGKHSGISWKVFKTKKKNEKPYIWKGYKLYRTGYDKGPIYCKTVSKQSKTSKCPTIGALSNYGYKKDLAENCPINYDWYAVLAFDGWQQYDTSKTRYFGPSAIGATYKSSNGNALLFYRSKTIQHNGEIDKSTFKTKFKNGTLKEGTRVSNATVRYLCKIADKGICKSYKNTDHSLPNGLGYVCIKDPDCTGSCCPGEPKYPNCDPTNDDGGDDDPTPPDSCGTLLSHVSGEVVTGTWVKNTSVDKYSESWHTGEANPVWAKPTDQIEWMNCYDSDIASKRKKQSTVNNVDPVHDTEMSGTQNHIDNNTVGSWLSWSNSWSVTGANSYNKSYSSTASITDEFPNNSEVTNAWIGLSTDETSRTGSPTKISISSSSHSWGCHWGVVGKETYTTDECEEKDKNGNCTKYKTAERDVYGYQDTCSHDDVYYLTNAEGSRSAKALVNVPYNYENVVEMEEGDETGNTADVEEGESDDEAYDIAYAGEERDGITFTISTVPHENENTDGEYATASPNTQYRFNLYVGDTLVGQNPPVSYPMNLGNNEDGAEATITNGTVIVPDVAAGTIFCTSVSVYPGTSGDYDMTGNGDGTWVESENRKCFMVAKRPSLQVWGGNVFSRGLISTSVANKLEIAGYGYSLHRIFGSFGELGLISSGATKGFASASSTGYGNISGGTLSPNPLNGFYNNSSNTSDPGGSNKNSICNRSQLTFANNPCSKLGQVGKTSTTTNLEEDKNNILGKFIRELDSANTGTHVVLNDRNKAQADGTYYYYSDSDLEVGNNATEVSVASSTIQMVHSKGTVFVRGNIVYGDTYKKYSELPKLVLYGKNVVIDCNVTRIDALIIADEKVATCNNYDNVSLNGNDTNLKDAVEGHIQDEANSHQLKINGAVVAKTLIANRTYGAATGANSIVPAEIINFDPTLYLWGGLGNEEGSDGDLKITMLRELAPRK